MKKLLVAFILSIGFFTSAQDGFPDEECRKAYESILNNDWNGFDGKGNKIPPAKLIYKGVVDFPYYDSNEDKKKYLKKIVEIYKYDPVIEITHAIPLEKLDFCSSPEMAYLSDSSDCRNCTPEDWEEFKMFVLKEKEKPSKVSLFLYYKMYLKADDGEVVAILTSNNFPFIMFKPKSSDKWQFIKSISFQENVLFYAIDDNLDLEELQGSYEERMEAKLKAIMSNKLTLPPDIEENLARKEAERKAKLLEKTSEAMETEFTPEEKRMNEAMDQILKNAEEGKADPPEIKAIFGDKYTIFREDAEEQLKRIKEKEQIWDDLTKERGEEPIDE